jgi:hypothetical protein
LGANRGGDVAKAAATKCPATTPTTTKTLRLRGCRDAPKRTRTSTRYPGPGPQPGNRRVRSVHFASERPPSCAGADAMGWSDDLDVATNVAARARRRCTSAPRWTDRTRRVPMYVVVASRDERSLPRAGVSSAPATGDRISSAAVVNRAPPETAASTKSEPPYRRRRTRVMLAWCLKPRPASGAGSGRTAVSGQRAPAAEAARLVDVEESL